MLRASLSGLALLTAFTPAAMAQAGGFAAPVAGEIVAGFEMIEDRTVIFELAGDGKVKILSVEDDNPAAAAPRNPGKVAVAMNYALETGTLLEFNNGLDYALGYDAMLAGSSGKNAVKAEGVCPVRKDAVGAESWPQPYPKIIISNFRRSAGAGGC